jgi:transcriptional regulator with XRE-family HTH domain
MNREAEPLAKALKAARKTKGLSQRALGKRAGVPQAHISKIEKGAVDLRVSSLVALARVLDLELTLVPRKAVAAVQSIVRNSEPQVLPRAAAAATKELQRLQKAIASFPTTPDTSREFAQFARAVRDLQHFSLRPAQLDAVREASKSVKALISRLEAEREPTKSPRASTGAATQTFRDFTDQKELAAFRQALSRVQSLRNEVAHTISPPHTEPVRPAYSLDDEEQQDRDA